MSVGLIDSASTKVLPLELYRRYPVVVRGEGVWVEDSTGRRYLDAMSGGSMAATLGFGRQEIIDAARSQAETLSYVGNERLTNPLRERLAAELAEVAPEGFTRVRFVTGGAEANEMGILMARAYHVERGEPGRWRVISPAQAYHGPTLGTLSMTGRPGLQRPFGPYLSTQPHIPPSTSHFDPSGRAALEALDRVIEETGPETISAYFCEPVSAAALPAYSPPDAFWEGLAERRERYGFLIVFDEVVTGMGRTGHWFAADGLPIDPDIIATAKGLGAGYIAVGGTLCTDRVYEAVARGSRTFNLGHTWDGAPVQAAVALKVLEILRTEGLIERVHDRGPSLREQLAAALKDIPLVGEVRGRGYLLGVEYVDPRDGTSFLPPELGVAGKIDTAAMERGLITLSTMPTRDGMAGDQTLFAPPFITSDDELAEMVERFAATVQEVYASVEPSLQGAVAQGA